MQSVVVVAGTRPEVVKLAPVYRALASRAAAPAADTPNLSTPKSAPHATSVSWLATGQHTELAEQTLAEFGIHPDIVLTVPRTRSDSVGATLAKLIGAVDNTLARIEPKLVVVQGDTTSTIATALAAFSRRIPIAHVEAGLRTFDLAQPFPEEAWRTLVSQIADFHFAPTETAAQNLKAAGARGRIEVTGNTVIDALHWLRAKSPRPKEDERSRRRITVTLHRRENWNGAFTQVCAALIELTQALPDTEICFVEHANPALREAAAQALGGRQNIRLVPPQGYGDFIRLLAASTLVLSDSGGVQEEAPALGIPVLVLRETTERPEAVAVGVAKLVGTDAARIVAETMHLLTDAEAYRQMARMVSPFGDGKAAERIADTLVEFLGSERRPARSVA